MRERRSEKNKEVAAVQRSTRYLQTEEGWYFNTREGVMLGPYLDQFDAEISASLLIARLAQLDPEADATPVIQRFLTDPANAHMASAPKLETKAYDLAQIRRQRKRENSLPTFRKAWKAISGQRG